MQNTKIIGFGASLCFGLASWALGELVSDLKWLPYVVLPISLVGMAIFGALWLFDWRCSNRRPSMPGIGLHLIIRIGDLADERRKYVFDFGRKPGPWASLFLSKSDAFIFSVTDINGEPYSLEIPTGWRGFPVAKWSQFSLEAGSDGVTAFLRASLNGRSVAYREIPFAVDFGALTVEAGALGMDRSGKNGGAFEVSQLVGYARTLDEREMRQLTKHMTENYGALD